MTPKEKAEELIDKYFILIKDKFEKWNISYGISHPKQCALIAVDEILNTCVESMIYYWQEVKQEIEKL